MITLLSVLLLGERVGPARWLALLLGFLGVLLYRQTRHGNFQPRLRLYPDQCAFYALTVIATRKLQSTDSSATMAYYSSLVYLAAALLLAPLTIGVGEIPGAHPSIAPFRDWTMPTLLDGIIMGGLGWSGRAGLISWRAPIAGTASGHRSSICRYPSM